jgi:hypothetical protein
MPKEFVVTSSATPGIGAFKAHYPNVEAALRFANVLLDEGAPPWVDIVDGEGNTIMRDDHARLRQRLVTQNIKGRDQLSTRLHNLETGTYYVGTNKAGDDDENIMQQLMCQLRIWISEIDHILTEPRTPRQNFAQTNGVMDNWKARKGVTAPRPRVASFSAKHPF